MPCPALVSWCAFAVALVGCSGSSAVIPDASTDGPTPWPDGATSLCGGGTIQCGDRCFDPSVDPKNCGGCGKLCAQGEVCSAGTCGLYCQAGYSLCTGSGGDGGAAVPYCANLQTDPINCGSCGTVCGSAHGIPSCTAGACTITCLGSWSDCDKMAGNGCEADLAADGKNCGKCGRDCAGGACNGSQCQPVVLVSNQQGPFGLAIDGTNVYWTNPNGGQVRLCAKNGCNNAPTTLASGQSYPYNVVVDGSNAYWTNYTGTGTVQKCALGGCGNNPTTLASAQVWPNGVAFDASNVYWTDYNQNGAVLMCAKGGCGNNPTTLVGPTGWPYQIAADSTNVYYTGNGARKCAVGGCGNNPTTLINNGWGGLAVDSTNIYVTGTGVSRCAIGGCGQNPTMLATTGFALGIAVDATDAYWTSPGSGTISKCALSGCNNNPALIALAQGTPENIKVDATSIYWTNWNAGTVVKLVK